MNNQEHQAGISLWNSKLQVVEVMNNNGELLIDNISEVYFNEMIDYVNDRETKIISTLQSAFDEILLQGKFSSKNVSFTLPSSLFYLMQCPYDSSLLHNDLIDEFKWELQLLLPYININDVVVQYIEVNKPKLFKYNSAIVITTLRKFLHIINKFCKVNNLNLMFVDNSHLSAEKTFNISDSIIASLFISYKSASLLMSSRNTPFFFKNFVYNTMGELPGLIEKEFNDNEELLVKKNMLNVIYIAGEELSVNLVNALGNKLQLDVVRTNPFEKVKVSDAVKRSNLYLIKYNSFSSAAGMAFRIN